MEIINIVTNAVKDVVIIGQSVTTAVKEEVEMYFESKRDSVEDMASDARETIESSSIYTRFEDLEDKVRSTIDASLEKLNFSKADDYEKIEKRIDSLEDKLTQLLASLEDMKAPAKTTRRKTTKKTEE
jgi:tetrahydromethanopterin S-methyltransferase subunit G